ncbi:MAG: carboxypeptidase regulatory-like domain-containing protein [Elusimicrobia bacterium]|nr:carboxypeptidase regulatory-like domain-containing protein [Elusimicrobiota bacterium]
MAYGVVADNIDNVIVVGSEERYDLGQGNNIWLRKYDPNGNTLWTKTYDGLTHGWDNGYGVTADDFGDIYIAGGIYNSNFNSDLWVAKYDPSGNFMESKTYDDSQWEEGYDIEISSIGKVYVSAQLGSSAGIYMYSQQAGGGPIISALSAYPGPNTGSVGLSWNYDNDLPQGSSYYIQIATTPAISWNPLSADIVVSTSVFGGMFQNEVARDLITSRGSNGEITSPNYYFQAWTSTNGANFNSLGGMATSYAKTPYISLYMNDFSNGGGIATLNTQNTATSVIIQNAQGDLYYAFGGVFGGDQALAIQKYDSQGNVVWTTFYNSATMLPLGSTDAKYQVYGATVDANGYLYLAGTEKNSLGNDNAFLGKFDANGYKEWAGAYGSVSYEDFYASVAMSPDSSKVYAVGAAHDGTSHNIRIDERNSSDGVFQSSPTIVVEAQNESAYGIDVDSSGNIYVTGETNQLGYQDIFIYKFSSTFGNSGTKYFENGGGSVYGAGIKVSSSNIYVAGEQNDDALMAKFAASDLAIISTKTYNSPANGVDVFEGITLDAEGNIYAAGHETNGSVKDILVRKYDENLNEMWTRTLPTGSNNAARTTIINRNNDEVLAALRIGDQPYGSAGFVVFPQFSAESSGLMAMPGNSAGAVDLAWISGVYISSGANYYIQYSTFTSGIVWSTTTAQIAGTTTADIPPGSKVDLTVTGLEAGLNAQNTIDSPAYYFKVWITTLPAVFVNEITATPTEGYAYTPMVWSNSFIYPNSKLFTTNGANNWRGGIAKDSAGNIYTVASYYDYNSVSAGSSVIVRKQTNDGAALWTRFYGLPVNGYGQSYGIAADDTGVYISGSETDYNSSQGSDALLLKYSPTGEFLWKKTHNGAANGYDYAYGVAIDTNGFVYAAGSEYVDGESDNIWLGKYTGAGALVWNWNFDASAGNYDYGYSVAIDTLGYVWIAGSANNDMWFGQFENNSGANEIVVGSYAGGGKGNDSAYGIAIDSQNYVYIVGSEYVDGQSDNIWLNKYESDLSNINEVWSNPVTYNDPANNYDVGYGVTVGTFGAVYITGSEARYDLNQGDNAFIRKYSPNGEILWTNSFDGGPGSYDQGYGIVVDNTGRVYISGNFNNAAGFYRTQTSSATTNPQLTVNVKMGVPYYSQSISTIPFVGASVSIIPFDQNGNIDPTNINMEVTDSSGAYTVSLPMGFKYFVGISAPDYMPSIKDQMMDPYGNFMIALDGDTMREYLLFPKSANEPDYTLRVHISSGGALNIGQFIMGDINFAQTGEKAAYGIVKTTDAAMTTMSIDNVPPSPAGSYSLNLNIPSSNASMTIFLDQAFPQVADYYIDLSSAINMVGSYDVSGSTVPPSFQCVVRSTTGFPLDGARVEFSKWAGDGTTNCGGYECWSKIIGYENKTDANGYVSFYDVPISSEGYNLDIRKKGYKNVWDNIMVMDNTYSIFRDYSLELATYTLTGILKYNSIPIPNADIMVWGAWDYYGGEDCDDSYCGDNKGMQVDAQTKTGPDGSFTLTGLTDGNVRLNASFYGTWMDLNQGNDPTSNWDDIRITISSAAAITPANGQLCSAGKVWALDKDGICKSAGNVIFNIQPTAGNSAGRIFGDIIFSTTYTVTALNPLVISTAAPITIMAIQECHENCGTQKIAFASIAGSFTSNTTNYSVILDTATQYWTRVASDRWGKLTSFDDRADFTSTDTVRMDFTLVRSGGLRGVVKFPNGNNFKPNWANGDENNLNAYWLDIELDGKDVDVRDGTGLDEYGEFYFPNVAPGIYNIKTRPRGAGFMWPPVKLEDVTVTQDNITEVKLNLTNGLFVKPQIFGLPAVSTPTWGYSVIAVPSGEQMNQKLVTELFFDSPKYEIDYSTTTGWETISMEPGQYDFYLILGAGYEPMGDEKTEESYHQFANFIGRVKNKGIKKDSDNPNIGAAAQPIAINILGAIGQEQIGGNLIGDRIFTAPDYERIFANFESELFPLIPAILLYDAAGDLRGFSHALPATATAFEGFWTGITNKSSATVEASFDAYPPKYLIWGLPAGNYTAVFANPNYPPVAKEIVLPTDASYDFDFDAQDLPVGTVSGIVKSSTTLLPIENAMVYLKHRTIEKFVKTDSSGAFSLANIPPGMVKMTVSKTGFVKLGQKMSLAGNQTIDDLSFTMLPSDSKITGKVYLKKFPAPATKSGIQLVAYDETLNVTEPTSYIPKMEAQTDDNGNFEITGVIPGHIYKVAAFYTGKLPEPTEVTAVEGNTVMDDIVLKDVPPQIVLKIRKSANSIHKMDVIIKSPKQLVTTPVCTYNTGTEYSSSTAVSLALVPGPNNSYLGQFTVSSDRYYILYVTAGDGSNKMTKQLTYDKVSQANTDQYIQNAAIAGGEVYMDSEQEEYSGIELDPGAVATSSSTADYSNLVGGFFSALPSVKTVKTDKGDMTLESAITNLMASEVYDMDLTNAQPNKPFSLNLKYDKEKALNSSALKIYQFADGQWKEVPGNYTVDPMIGTVSVDVAGLEFAYEGTGDTSTPLARKKFKMSAISPRGTYVPSAAGSSQSGQFAVFTAKPGTGVLYTGSSFEVYNMPNPFNLKSKTIASIEGTAAFVGLSGFDGTNYTTDGTLIKYHLPAGKSGTVKFVIYNTAGEKVRTIDDDSRPADSTNYSEWDGKNDKGTKCASGVYFMLTYLDGEQLGNKAHKMALIK